MKKLKMLYVGGLLAVFTFSSHAYAGHIKWDRLKDIDGLVDAIIGPDPLTDDPTANLFAIHLAENAEGEKEQ